MSYEATGMLDHSDGATPKKEGPIKSLKLDGVASAETTPRSRTTSAQTDATMTPTTAAFDFSRSPATPKNVNGSQSTESRPATILPTQTISPKPIPGSSSSASLDSDAQKELNAARAALDDVHLTDANIHPPSHSESSPRSSRPPSISIPPHASSSSPSASPITSRPPSSPRRRSGSQASSRRGSSSGIHESASGRRLSTASSSTTHRNSPRLHTDGEPSWAPTDVRKSSVVEASDESGSSSMIIIRDFAFDVEDPRFKGIHPEDDTGKRNSSSRASRLSESESPAMGNDAFGSSGSSGFSWGFVTSHATDFNTSEDDSQLYSEDENSSRSDFDYHDSAALEQALGAFVPGVYSAMYDFAPELETEMAISSGDLVTVFSRQCAGWVQAARIKDGTVTGEVGLVPENYLTLVEEADYAAAREGTHWEDETPLAEEEAQSYEEAGVHSKKVETTENGADGERRKVNDEAAGSRTKSEVETEPPP